MSQLSSFKNWFYFLFFFFTFTILPIILIAYIIQWVPANYYSVCVGRSTGCLACYHHCLSLPTLRLKLLLSYTIGTNLLAVCARKCCKKATFIHNRARWLHGNARDSHSGDLRFKSRCRPTWLGFFRGFPQSSRQMLGWIFITTIHFTIIHQIHIS